MVGWVKKEVALGTGEEEGREVGLGTVWDLVIRKEGRWVWVLFWNLLVGRKGGGFGRKGGRLGNWMARMVGLGTG